MKRIAGESYPSVKQTLNTCGLASMAMIFLHHAPFIKEFLLKVDERILQRPGTGKSAVLEPVPRREEDEAIISALGYLLLKAANSRRLRFLLSKATNPFDYDDFRISIQLMLGTTEAERELKKNPELQTLFKLYQGGIIRKKFLRFYLSRFKTQLELKMLAALFGFKFVPYATETMGNLYFENHDDMDRADKIDFIRQRFADGQHAVLLGHGQLHWMVPHTLYENGNEKYVLEINDPLGGSTLMPVEKLDHTYIFYFFKFNETICRRNIAILEEILHFLKKADATQPAQSE